MCSRCLEQWFGIHRTYAVLLVERLPFVPLTHVAKYSSLKSSKKCKIICFFAHFVSLNCVLKYSRSKKCKNYLLFCSLCIFELRSKILSFEKLQNYLLFCSLCIFGLRSKILSFEKLQNNLLFCSLIRIFANEN